MRIDLVFLTCAVRIVDCAGLQHRRPIAHRFHLRCYVAWRAGVGGFGETGVDNLARVAERQGKNGWVR